ncbi:MAG: hypothetical protein ACK5M7_03100 [Draconibacterium sp.]
MKNELGFILPGVRELRKDEILVVDGGTIFWWTEMWGGANILRTNPNYPFYQMSRMA